MATYTVKAPDGKTVTLEGPDGASQSAIIAQAQALYKPQTAAPKPAARKPAEPNQFLEKYNTIRNGITAKLTDPNDRKYALNRFDSDPRAQALRKAAGLAPLSTANGEVRQAARKSVQQRMQDAGADVGKGSTGFQSASAGIARGAFGIPEIIAAAGERFLPSAITGNDTDASFSNILQMIRSKDTAAIAAHPVAGVAGELGGGLVGGGAAGKLFMRSARAASSVPALARFGQAVESLGTLRKGAKLANTAKIVATGAGAGAAQAAGEGSDIVSGAETGAVAAPVVVGIGSLAGKFLLRPAADILHLSKADSYLRRFTSATANEMRQKLADFRAKTGADPTLFELLPLSDRNRLIQNTVAGRDPVVEQVSNAIRERSANVQPEMADVVHGATDQQRRLTQRQLVQNLADANGGTTAKGDAALALRASQSPTDMLTLRRVESSRIMAPHDQSHVADKFVDLVPQVPENVGGTVVMREADPEVTSAIRSVAGTLPKRPKDAGITVQDVTHMISELRSDAGKGGIEGRAADRAAQHLMDVLDENVPEAAAATQKMRDAYAAHSRMAEGMGEGWQQRLRDEIQVKTNNTRARGVQNAYDTDEGVAGRQLGQTNRLVSDLSGTPQNAIKNTIDLARNGNPAVAENLGQTAADEIQTAAQAQAQSVEALSAAQQGAKSGQGTAFTPEDITTGLLALGPHPFAKANIVRKLLQFSILPPAKAKIVGEMLFSQDPRLIERAVRAVGNEPNSASFMKYLASVAGSVATDANASDPGPPPEADTAEVPQARPLIEEPAPDAAPEEQPPAPAAGDSPYAAQLQKLYSTENPDLLDLIGRVKVQEHGTDANGNFLTSKAGAVGPMQVMPDTAPEAAKLAGLPWDENAYRTDPAYNELLGIAYLSEQLRKYHGDVARALAAYNAGPDATDTALSSHGDNFLAALPAETQDYVAKVS